jgi:hypothetical protein
VVLTLCSGLVKGMKRNFKHQCGKTRFYWFLNSKKNANVV